MIRRTSILAVALATSLAISLPTSAANKYAGEFLTHGVGARPLGMGGAFVAVADDASSGYWNPAGVADVAAGSVQLMHSETFGDIVKYDTGSYVHPLEDGTALAITVVRLAVDDIGFTDFEQDDDRIHYELDRITWKSDSEMAFLGTYAKRVTDRLRIGGNLKIVWKSIADYACYGIGFDLGAKYEVIDGLTVGTNVQDATTTFLVWDTKERERIMPTVKIGLAYSTDIPSMSGTVVVAADADVRFENRLLADEYHIGSISADTHYGAEFRYRDMLSVRTGLSTGQLTAGAGIELGSFDVDYAFGKHEHLESSHRVSASYGF